MTQCHQCDEFRKPWGRADECMDGNKQACMKFSREYCFEHGIQNWGENNKCEWPCPKTSGSCGCSEKEFTTIGEVTEEQSSAIKRINAKLIDEALSGKTSLVYGTIHGPSVPPRKKKNENV
jgi:hypothetical protein